jgi:hypothetical protein
VPELIKATPNGIVMTRGATRNQKARNTTPGEEHTHSWPQDDVLLITLLNFGFVSLTKIDVSLVHKLSRAVRKNDTSNRDVLLPV